MKVFEQWADISKLFLNLRHWSYLVTNFTCAGINVLWCSLSLKKYFNESRIEQRKYYFKQVIHYLSSTFAENTITTCPKTSMFLNLRIVRIEPVLGSISFDVYFARDNYFHVAVHFKSSTVLTFKTPDAVEIALTEVIYNEQSDFIPLHHFLFPWKCAWCPIIIREYRA